MAVQRFTELLHKLKEVHEQEVEGWQDKVLELTNKKNCDAKRLEELYNRNQQLREQQRILTENIKQLENMLRAGLCDRCTVTQEVAKKRQQEYENSQLQSLQHISILMAETSALMKENSRLRGELKSLGRRTEEQNGDSEEPGTPDVKRSPDPAGSTFTLATSVLKPEQAPTGGAFAPTAAVKSETDQRSDQKQLQDWSGTQHFEVNKDSAVATSATLAGWRERRVASVDSLVPRLSPTSPSNTPHLRLLKSGPYTSPSSEERHAPVSVPLRPHPIKTAPPTLRWPFPEHSDWLTAGTGDSRSGDSAGGGGVVVQTNTSQDSTMIRFPGLLSSPGSFDSHRHARPFGHLRPLWVPLTTTGQKSISELVDAKDRSKPTSVIAPPCWKSPAVQRKQIFEDTVKERVEEDAPLDLSNTAGFKAKEAEMSQSQFQCETALSLSSSPDAPLSSPCSARYGSSPQSDPQAGDSKPQREKTWEKTKEEHDEENEKNENAGSSENQKTSTLTISLCPVVIVESLKHGRQAEPDGELGVEQREEDNNGRTTARKRADQAAEALPRHPLKEKRMRIAVIPKGSNQEDTEQS